MEYHERLRYKDLYKLAERLYVSFEVLDKLNTAGIINITQAKNHLILSDWRKLKRDGVIAKHAVMALSEEYQVSEDKINKVVYKSRSSVAYCDECASIITKAMYLKNKGVCDKCIVNKIKL